MGEFNDKMIQDEKDTEEPQMNLLLQRQHNTSEHPNNTEGLGTGILKTIGTSITSAVEEVSKQYASQLGPALRINLRQLWLIRRPEMHSWIVSTTKLNDGKEIYERLKQIFYIHNLQF